MPLICLMIPFHFFICFILCYAFSLSCLPAKCFDICLLKTKKHKQSQINSQSVCFVCHF